MVWTHYSRILNGARCQSGKMNMADRNENWAYAHLHLLELYFARSSKEMFEACSRDPIACALSLACLLLKTTFHKFVQALEVDWATWRPHEGSNTKLNYSCPFIVTLDTLTQSLHAFCQKHSCKFESVLKVACTLWAQPGDQEKTLKHGSGSVAGTQKVTFSSDVA